RDSDILLFGEMEIDEHGLTVPHPRMHQRAFVLVPLVEMAPTIFIPGKGFAKGLLATVGSAGVGPLQWDGLS
ncbi:MAG: 2-amino-4-hydroxy-6-hydroxymethyldihydropteridine diphosphokinase, partial [Usitatibacteraceae bacterium]